MSLEEEVAKLMDDPIHASAPMLAADVGERDPNAPMRLDEIFELVEDQIIGLKRAILRLAREIDQTRDI